MLGPITGILLLLINIFIFVLIVRAILSWFPGAMYTEAGRIVLVATEWYLAPIRRVIPPAGGLDISFLVGIVILYALSVFLGSGSIISALVTVIGYALVFIIILLLVRIFFGFFKMDPWHPITQMVMQSTEIFARPFRGFFPRPRHGGFDWAPVAAFVVVLVVYVLVTNVYRLGLG
ncbi:MAG: YggT family protein [Chloroflexi bacterium]|nr:MAG: YggT family protein [Chloroflexota bacterium]TME45829.1 MAG: YggT family protein [Chloroflexota bacterium]